LSSCRAGGGSNTRFDKSSGLSWSSASTGINSGGAEDAGGVGGSTFLIITGPLWAGGLCRTSVCSLSWVIILRK
jgi:hypothetical protein